MSGWIEKTSFSVVWGSETFKQMLEKHAWPCIVCQETTSLFQQLKVGLGCDKTEVHARFLTNVKWCGPKLGLWTGDRAFHLHFDTGQCVIITGLHLALLRGDQWAVSSTCPLQGFSNIDRGDRLHFEAKHVGLDFTDLFREAVHYAVHFWDHLLYYSCLKLQPI